MNPISAIDFLKNEEVKLTLKLHYIQDQLKELIAEENAHISGKLVSQNNNPGPSVVNIKSLNKRPNINLFKILLIKKNLTQKMIAQKTGKSCSTAWNY